MFKKTKCENEVSKSYKLRRVTINFVKIQATIATTYTLCVDRQNFHLRLCVASYFFRKLCP